MESLSHAKEGWKRAGRGRRARIGSRCPHGVALWRRSDDGEPYGWKIGPWRPPTTHNRRKYHVGKTVNQECSCAQITRSALGHDLGSLRQSAAERGVLAGDLVEHDDQVSGGYPGRRHDLLVQAPEQRQPGLFGTPRDEGQLEQDHVVRVCLPEERRRVEVAVARQHVVDLEEVVGRDAEDLDQGVLDRPRHFPETGRVILALEHVDLCERHGVVSFSAGIPPRGRPGAGGDRTLGRFPQPCDPIPWRLARQLRIKWRAVVPYRGNYGTATGLSCRPTFDR